MRHALRPAGRRATFCVPSFRVSFGGARIRVTLPRRAAAFAPCGRVISRAHVLTPDDFPSLRKRGAAAALSGGLMDPARLMRLLRRARTRFEEGAPCERATGKEEIDHDINSTLRGERVRGRFPARL
ncbi:hypothetical protein PUN4_60128 [Paraburkholderia unamae]|nr:hypothetical protein PUN4_60128 [Paraburkholderia unamae]